LLASQDGGESLTRTGHNGLKAESLTRTGRNSLKAESLTRTGPNGLKARVLPEVIRMIRRRHGFYI